MIYARIHRVLKRWQRNGRILPQSSLDKAISYALGRWDSLEVYLKDGTIEIDNNLIENAIRERSLTGLDSALGFF
jgi:transposase